MRLKNDTNNFAASFNITPPYQMLVLHSKMLIYPRELYQRGVQRKRVEMIAADFNESQLYEELISYADLYDSASFEAKKMIVSQLIRRVDVYRGYQIHVDFNFDLAQYLENSDELAC